MSFLPITKKIIKILGQTSIGIPRVHVYLKVFFSFLFNLRWESSAHFKKQIKPTQSLSHHEINDILTLTSELSDC